jgi:hypothetical protein
MHSAPVLTAHRWGPTRLAAPGSRSTLFDVLLEKRMDDNFRSNEFVRNNAAEDAVFIPYPKAGGGFARQRFVRNDV